MEIARAVFLPIGADVNAAAFRVTASDGASYFLKLRRGAFCSAAVAVPDFLHRVLGLDTVPAPIPTRRHELWASAEGFHWVLYPFIEGVDGFQRALSDAHWSKLGATMRAVHDAALPAALLEQLPWEDHAPHARSLVRDLHEGLDQRRDEDPIARELAAFWRANYQEIQTILDRAEALARALAERELKQVLCHADLHAGNVLIGADDALFVVDWDTMIRAPRERDLMFVGGGVGGVWNDAREERLFRRGYGEQEIDRVALAYYRYERIVVDIAEASEPIFAAQGSRDDRRALLQLTRDQLAPGNVVEIAHRTYRERYGVRARRKPTKK